MSLQNERAHRTDLPQTLVMFRSHPSEFTDLRRPALGIIAVRRQPPACTLGRTLRFLGATDAR